MSNNFIKEKILLDGLKTDHSIYINQINEYEKKKVTYIKMAMGLYAILIPIVVFIYPKSVEVGQNNLISYSSQVLPIILILIGVISLVVLRYLSSTISGSASVIRQINCIRKATYSIYEKILNEDYVEYIGKHILLPTDNSALRRKHCNSCRFLLITADGMLIVVLSLMSLITIFIGSVFIIKTELSMWIVFSIFIVSLVAVMTTMKSVYFFIRPKNKAFDCKKGERYPFFVVGR